MRDCHDRFVNHRLALPMHLKPIRHESKNTGLVLIIKDLS